MTLEQRAQGFQASLAQLQQQYGITLKADIQVEKLGDAVLSRPVLQAMPMADWQPEVAPAAMQNGAAEAKQ